MQDFIKSTGEKPFRAGQIRKWLFESGVSDFNEMTNLSKSLRARLDKIAMVTELKEEMRLESEDGTLKFVYKLDDGLFIESVLIPEGKRMTLCVSTQVGCKLNCKFCLTGLTGFKRNLTAGEIVDQVIKSRERADGARVTNVVLMGMGEPLDNFKNTVQALKIMTDTDFRLVGVRKITLSTAGVAPGIDLLAQEFPKVKLAVSLNTCDDAVRDNMMPINKKYPLKTLASALARFPLPKGRRITIEYVMIKDVNDSNQDAEKLKQFAFKFPSKINLIPFNECHEIPYARPSRRAIERFADTLIAGGHSVFIRESRGRDIMAACGQLRQTAETKATAP